MNATQALNFIIKGVAKPNTNVIISPFEHNSVYRPLHKLATEIGIQVRICPADESGGLRTDDLSMLIDENTSLVAISHASNVTGRVQDIVRISDATQRRSVPLLLDVSQTVGVLPIEIDALDIGLVAGSCHKGLEGPQGLGFLYVANPDSVDTYVEGGTGGNSYSPMHPQRGPERFEAGTHNMPAIAGLVAALHSDERVNHNGSASELTLQLCDFLIRHEGFELYGRSAGGSFTSVVSFNVCGRQPTKVGFLLDRDHGIAVRAGLHCSPLAHKWLGTYPNGTIRVSFGRYNTESDLFALCHALRNIAGERV
jgi:selenocysteine lyase/cysteine desulfurase